MSYLRRAVIDEILRYERSRGPSLAKLDIELTHRCNNNCVHCCINQSCDSSAARERELSTTEVKTLIDEAVTLGCLSVRFTGGEPLLREDFEELYVYARTCGLRAFLFTNATRINERLARVFERMPLTNNIDVTLYGMTTESYRQATGNAEGFRAAWRGMELLTAHGVPFSVRFPLLPSTKHERMQFETWVKTIPSAQPPYYSIFFDYRSLRDSDARNRAIEAMRTSPDEGVRFFMQSRDADADALNFCSKLEIMGERLFHCLDNVRGVAVDARGLLLRCLLMRAPEMSYDLRKGSLRKAMIDFFPTFSSLRAANPEYLRRCARCFLKKVCEQCPARSWVEYGVLDRPVEYICAITHARARYFGLLQNHEQAWEVRDWRERGEQTRRCVEARWSARDRKGEHGTAFQQTC